MPLGMWIHFNQGSNLVHPELEAWSLNHPTTREVPCVCCFELKCGDKEEENRVISSLFAVGFDLQLYLGRNEWLWNGYRTSCVGFLLSCKFVGQCLSSVKDCLLSGDLEFQLVHISLFWFHTGPYGSSIRLSMCRRIRSFSYSRGCSRAMWDKDHGSQLGREVQWGTNKMKNNKGFRRQI